MSKNSYWNIPSWLWRGLVLVVVVVLGMAFSPQIFDRLKAALFEQAPPTVRVTTSETIVTGLQPLGQVVSLSVQVAKADINVSAYMGGLNLCGHSARHVAQATIEAGIDITQITEESVVYDERTNTYTLILPSPVITSCRIDYFDQYDRSGGLPPCRVDWENVEDMGQYVAMTEFVEDSLAGGILERAKTETTTVMRSFVGSLTNSNVTIRYAEANRTMALHSSCQPEIPAGWELNAETGDWIRVD